MQCLYFVWRRPSACRGSLLWHDSRCLAEGTNTRKTPKLFFKIIQKLTLEKHQNYSSKLFKNYHQKTPKLIFKIIQKLTLEKHQKFIFKTHNTIVLKSTKKGVLQRLNIRNHCPGSLLPQEGLLMLRAIWKAPHLLLNEQHDTFGG